MLFRSPDGLGGIVELVAVGARQVAAAHGNDVRQDGMAGRGQPLGDHLKLARAPVCCQERATQLFDSKHTARDVGIKSHPDGLAESYRAIGVYRGLNGSIRHQADPLPARAARHVDDLRHRLVVQRTVAAHENARLF